MHDVDVHKINFYLFMIFIAVVSIAPNSTIIAMVLMFVGVVFFSGRNDFDKIVLRKQKI